MIEIAEGRFRDVARNPRALLNRIGEVGVEVAQASFVDQGFSGRRWPEAYEGREPRIRLANLVGDLLEGKRPPDRVREGRPAGTYSGELYKSIAKEVTNETATGGAVEVGSDLPYASHFQVGGRSTQAITADVRDGLTRWLDQIDPPEQRKIRRRNRTLKQRDRKLSTEHDSAKEKRRQAIVVARAKIAEERRENRVRLADAPSNAYRQAVGFLFSVDELVTNSVGRQFIGVTPEVEKRLAQAAEHFFASAR